MYNKPWFSYTKFYSRCIVSVRLSLFQSNSCLFFFSFSRHSRGIFSILILTDASWYVLSFVQVLQNWSFCYANVLIQIIFGFFFVCRRITSSCTLNYTSLLTPKAQKEDWSWQIFLKLLVINVGVAGDMNAIANIYTASFVLFWLSCTKWHWCYSV